MKAFYFVYKTKNLAEYNMILAIIEIFEKLINIVVLLHIGITMYFIQLI